jgi:hypothetical protein
MEPRFFDIRQGDIEENSNCLKNLKVYSDDPKEEMLTGISINYPLLEKLTIEISNRGESEEIPISYVEMSMPVSSLKKMILKIDGGITKRTKTFFKLITGDSQPSYFSLVLLPSRRN